MLVLQKVGLVVYRWGVGGDLPKPSVKIKRRLVNQLNATPHLGAIENLFLLFVSVLYLGSAVLVSIFDTLIRIRSSRSNFLRSYIVADKKMHSLLGVNKSWVIFAASQIRSKFY
jgi:hypothetical protein